MTSKMDRRLIREIEERRQQASIEGRTAQEFALEEYQVTIELQQTLSPPKGKSRADAISHLEGQAEAHQSSIVNVLTSMGVADFKVLPLSNSIKTSLTTEQINEIAKHPDVKIVRLVKPERVIT